MSELKAYTFSAMKRIGLADYYLKSEVDKVLEEKDKKIRRLYRALYKACTNWACAKMEYEQFDSNMFMCGVITDKEVSWESMMKNCQAKMEEYR